MPRLFPPARAIDVRRQNLERLRVGILDAVKGKPERQVREVNHALRELLEVNYQVLLTPPTDSTEIDRLFIARQFRQWLESQTARFDQWERSGRRGGPDWALLSLTTRESLVESLDALRASIEHRYDDLARWLGRVAGQAATVNSDLRNTQLRRHLAVRMANELVFRRGGDGEPADEDAETDSEEAVSPPIGRECLTYRAFLRPFVEGQLSALIALRVDPLLRPENIPGDRELVDLCARHHLAQA
jgi:hypothetical protein